MNHEQPLDQNADFKFRESKTLVVFSTRRWFELREPILRVVHYQNGDWQFLTDSDQMSEPGKEVPLVELITRDKTLNDLFNLDYGEVAERRAVGRPWIRYKLENETQGM